MNSLCSALAVGALVLGTAGSAHAASYNCLPASITEEPNRIAVECAEPVYTEGGFPVDGTDRIRFFALPLSDLDFARRLEVMATTALISGAILRFEYVAGDTSGAAYGCASSNCRKPWAVGLVAPGRATRLPFVEQPSASPETIAGDTWRYFGPFSISEFRKVTATLSGTGNADLFVGVDPHPTATANVCASKGSTSVESCVVSMKGTYYVAVKGTATTSTFTLKVQIATK